MWWLSGWSTPTTRSTGTPSPNHRCPAHAPTSLSADSDLMGPSGVGVQNPFFSLLMLHPTGASSHVSAAMGRCMTTSSMSGCREGR